ncbi:hypothetical protein ACFFOS_13780 [Nocardioides kongjuensis]|uniref:ABC-type dipeptide/oligopeptide/nickel transport system permease subunit n=1 Tax=Nocardioides kongjuensis TaxID=349522 RepID=A0A852RUL8_9ACTN|nr:hypothetical protein [Nocardioides kongjuensis]NYD32570.1 ABC-type dipeptide/oligopeptide/nickel transport system permease subunit [Nocardioides kongjuensis]
MLAAVGSVLLLAVSRPIDWNGSGPATAREWAVIAAVLGASGLVFGTIAGALDGNFAHEPSRINAVFAVVYDAVLLAPHWWLSLMVLGLLQLPAEPAPPAALAVPVLGWLVGAVVLHVVSGAVEREL